MRELRASFQTILLVLLLIPNAHALKDGDVFGDWRAECVTPKDSKTGKANCHIFQNLLRKETNKRVLHIAIGRVPGQELLALIITAPLAIALPPGLVVRVDQKNPKQIPVQACFPRGCQAVFPLNDEWKKSLSSGANAEVIFYNIHNKAIAIQISLKGLTAAIKALGKTR